jgi:CHAD domain-containing protein
LRAVAYELRGDETIGAGLARVQLAQMDDAIAALRNVRGGDERHDALHDARTRLRMLRAMLKLQRPALSRAFFERQNAFLREAARVLSTARDAHVLQAALGGVAPDATAVAALRERLAAESAEAQRRLDELGIVQALARALLAERDLLESAPPPPTKAVWQGLRLTYARARRAARRTDDMESRHEWRKRVKDLRFQVRFLAPLWPAILGPHEKALHHLSDLLGEDHDLAVLDQWLMSRGPGASLPAGLEDAITTRRHHLQQEAGGLVARLLGERPRAFAERLEWYAESHQPRSNTLHSEVF